MADFVDALDSKTGFVYLSARAVRMLKVKGLALIDRQVFDCSSAAQVQHEGVEKL